MSTRANQAGHGCPAPTGHPGQSEDADAEALRVRLRLANEVSARREKELLDEIRFVRAELTKARDLNDHLRSLIAGATSVADRQTTVDVAAPGDNEENAETSLVRVGNSETMTDDPGEEEQVVPAGAATSPSFEDRIRSSNRRSSRDEPVPEEKTERQRLREAAVLPPPEEPPEPEPEEPPRRWWRLGR